MIEQSLFDKATLLVEALIFATAQPVKPQAMKAMLEGQGLASYSEQLPAIIEEIERRYENHAVALYNIAGGWQLRTRESVAPALVETVEKPRRLSRSTMEVLAIVAYHQPCTRTEIETVRGVTLGQSIFDTLLEEGLVAPKGRKEVPGRPILWSTTSLFLRVFGLSSLGDLPRREELVLEPSLEDDRPSESTMGASS